MGTCAAKSRNSKQLVALNVGKDRLSHPLQTLSPDP